MGIKNTYNSEMARKKHPNHISKNKKAFFDFAIEDKLEAGIVLLGWEVKAIRQGRIQITESHVIVKKGEVWLIGALITPLQSASTHIDADPTRTRKLLLKKRESHKLIGLIERKGYTLVPLSLYWKKHRVKLEIAVAKGKKNYDKRHTIKERDWDRQKARMVKQF